METQSSALGDMSHLKEEVPSKIFNDLNSGCKSVGLNLTPSAADFKYESEDEEDDGINHDEVILGNTTDVILYLARAYGNEFLTHFDNV